MVRFQRQPPGTAITRASLLVGGLFAAAAGWTIVARELRLAGVFAGVAAVLLLVGGHRANHGEGGPVDRMLTELLDRGWDAAVLGPIAWVEREAAPHVAIGALVALCASFLSSYVRARGAALGYSIEESHVTRGLRYVLLTIGLLVDGLGWAVWAAAAISVLAAVLRTGQVAREETA
ncbi:MAG TPA: hypothetical protein VK646_05740 [Actinomycetota bacterium]|nr:hypothetical protein [Actinomycetota bacterium]